MPKGYIVFVRSVSPFVCPSVNPFYNQVLLRNFLITYNSAATDQKLFIFGMGVPGRVLFHSTSVDPWVMPQGRAKGQNIGHPNKVVYCSLFIQTTSSCKFCLWGVYCFHVRPSIHVSVSASVRDAGFFLIS